MYSFLFFLKLNFINLIKNNFVAEDHSQSEEAFKLDLLNIARTTLSSKLLT